MCLNIKSLKIERVWLHERDTNGTCATILERKRYMGEDGEEGEGEKEKGEGEKEKGEGGAGVCTTPPNKDDPTKILN